MKVFKFGGASVKDAESVKNVKQIVEKHLSSPLMIVVSAMGKTTNALEKVVNHAFNKQPEKLHAQLNAVKNYHYQIIDQLFENKNHPVYNEINNLFVTMEWELEDLNYSSYDFVYDQVVSFGELLSTKIIAAYLQQEKISCQWVDARDLIRTDNNYRQARVDWPTTQELISKKIDFRKNNIYITQGFIAGTSENYTTTLGREGSDYSAAILAYFLSPNEMIVWKDVPGFLNSDPKIFPDAQILPHISYKEAIELAYYGASVIHPKTIKPLQNKNIPLKIKSFLHPEDKGSLIDHHTTYDHLIPSFIIKNNQRLISISPKDFAFIVEAHLSEIFQIFNEYKITMNIMQNSALNFSLTVNESEKIDALIEKLQTNYHILYNKNTELITIRHYTSDVINKLLKNKKVLLEQKTRNTARFVVSQ